MKRNLIIEFNGIPGSGKTTLSNDLIADLKDSENSIESLKKLLKKPSKRNIRQLISFLIKIKPSSLKAGYYVLMDLFRNKKIDKDNLLRIYALIIVFDFYQKKGSKDLKEIIVADDGIIQQVISLYFGSELRLDQYLTKFIKYTKKRIPNLIIININLNIDQTFNRLKKRNSNISRIQTVDEITALQILRVQENNFKEIRKIINEVGIESFDITTEISRESNVMLLENYIKEIKNR